MRPVWLLAAILLVPAASAGGSTAPFSLASGQAQTFRLAVDQPGPVTFAVTFDGAGVARDLTLSGPGSFHLSITASGAGHATMGMVKCAMPAGTSFFTLRMGTGIARGTLGASAGRWT